MHQHPACAGATVPDCDELQGVVVRRRTWAAREDERRWVAGSFGKRGIDAVWSAFGTSNPSRMECAKILISERCIDRRTRYG